MKQTSAQYKKDRLIRIVSIPFLFFLTYFFLIITLKFCIWRTFRVLFSRNIYLFLLLMIYKGNDIRILHSKTVMRSTKYIFKNPNIGNGWCSFNIWTENYLIKAIESISIALILIAMEIFRTRVCVVWNIIWSSLPLISNYSLNYSYCFKWKESIKKFLLT